MEYQSFGRYQRPKGANIRKALQVMLLLAVCAWMGYQIKTSTNKKENYGGQTKLVEGYGAISLGRKGTPSRLDERALPDTGNVDSAREAKESSSGRDDVFDGAIEDKTEEEFGHANEKSRTNEGKVELEPERQPTVSSKNKYKDYSEENSGKVYIESRRNESDHKEQGNEKYQKIPVINDSESNDKENDEDEVPRMREEETGMQENVVESATNAGLTERIDGVHSFHDENGVPPDSNETELVVGQAHILQEENISNFSKGSRLGNFYEVTSGEDSDLEMTLEGSKNDATADGSITHVDTSGINGNSEIGEGDSSVL